MMTTWEVAQGRWCISDGGGATSEEAIGRTITMKKASASRASWLSLMLILITSIVLFDGEAPSGQLGSVWRWPAGKASRTG